MLKIGKLNLQSAITLAPMAGVSDLPFRLLNRDFGCELAFTEMLNVRSLGFGSRKTRSMLASNAQDRPLGVQILGCEEEFIRRGLAILSEYKFDILDFNAACPVKKVVRRGEGAGLLREPQKLAKILKIVVKEANVPVTVKIRSGWGRDSVNAVEVAERCEGSGVSAIFIHGRTREQGYSGCVDYGIIRKVKEAVEVPVIGSGDMFSAALAKKMLDETGCDGASIARGALGNPWIFREIQEFLRNGKLRSSPGIEEIAQIMLKHLSMCVDFYGERNGVVIFRKFFTWYTKGKRCVRPLRERSSRAKTQRNMEDIIQECCELKELFLS